MHRSDEVFDVGVLTVIAPELQAVQDALTVNRFHDRLHRDGSIYFRGRVYSKIHDRDLNIVVGCVSAASHGNASSAATDMIRDFDPAVMILLGIAAGRRGKLKIGDVVVPREVADLSVRVAEGGDEKPRPNIIPLSHAI